MCHIVSIYDNDHMRYDADHLTGPALTLKYCVRYLISYLFIHDNDRMRYDADHLTGPALTLKYCVRYLISYLFIYQRLFKFLFAAFVINSCVGCPDGNTSGPSHPIMLIDGIADFSYHNTPPQIDIWYWHD